ncbi:tigger transposable element-derived protein 1 [Hydra vulgaris]|nr:tigger transposable element-derived protein 1-like [Hydra vulgaris]
MTEIIKGRKYMKRKSITLMEKTAILDRLKNGEKVFSVAKSLNLNESTIRTLKKNEVKIRKTVANSCPSGAKRATRIRNAIMIKMERALMIWLEDCVSKKIPVCGNLIKRKALKIYEHFKGTDNFSLQQHNHSFTASAGWLDKLKKRYSLHNIKFQGEQASADVKAAEKFKTDLPEIIDKEGYVADQIFNADETGLYWKKLPSRTHISINEKKASGFKSSKQRITIHKCSNLSGSLLIKPMIINNFLNPRAFKNVNMSELPVFWRANKKAWMTRELFKDWFYNCFVPQVESFMVEKNLSFRVLLILDNASSHSAEINHPNVKVLYFPPNCTSLIQPLDQGIIQTFKMYYIQIFFEVIFSRLEDQEWKTLLEVWKEFSILDCTRIVSLACTEIKQSTLNACWRPLLPQIVKKEDNISETVKEITRIVSSFGKEGFADIQVQDIEQLLQERSLNEEELAELIDESTSETFVEEDTNNKSALNFTYDLKKGLDLAEELEFQLTQNDPSTIRSEKFKREFQNCLAPYKEVLKELQNKITFENQGENFQSEEDYQLIRVKKRRRIGHLIFDSDDE